MGEWARWAMPTRSSASIARAVLPGNAHKRVGPRRPERTTSIALALIAPPEEMRWGTEPIFFQGTRPRAVIERPKRRASPLVMGAVPRMALSVVDLPDPFEPVMATVWPAGIDREIP